MERRREQGLGGNEELLLGRMKKGKGLLDFLVGLIEYLLRRRGVKKLPWSTEAIVP